MRDRSSDLGDRPGDSADAYSQVTPSESQTETPKTAISASVTQSVTAGKEPRQRKGLLRRWRAFEEKPPRIKEPKAGSKPQTEKKAKAQRVRPAGRRDLPWILRAPRMLFLALSGVMVFIITVAGMIESWRNLYEWGLAHHWGSYAVGVPVLVDFFILAAEMLLFVTIVDGRYGAFAWVTKVYLWFMFFFGLVLSLGGNIDHLRHADVPSRIGFALPPLASAMGMAAILMVLKMIAEDYDAPQDAPAKTEPAGTRNFAPSVPPVPPPAGGAPRAKAGAAAPKVVKKANGTPRSVAQIAAARSVQEDAVEHARQELHKLDQLPGRRPVAASWLGGNERAAEEVLALVRHEREHANGQVL